MGMYRDLFAVPPWDVPLLESDPTVVERYRTIQRSAGSLSLEKAWHGLHFLLTGSDWAGDRPLNFLLLGGKPVGRDHGYGPSRLLSPPEVKVLCEALYELDDDNVWSRFDPPRMTDLGIYPLIWDEPEQDLREEYLGYFHDMRSYIGQSADTGAAVLILVT